ncbi:MAG TPA: DJ-1/PfpI family protein [Casimicrobiaceae bacterium]|nr:DJ-1/PfpI family protein [Casimicrobiaceae bacterium]
MSNEGNSMGKVGVFLYDGFQEMEFWYPVLRLREIGADVVVIGVDGVGAATSVLGYPVVPNVAMTDTSPGDYVALIVPGGDTGKLAANAAFRAFLRDAGERQVRVAAATQAAALAPAALIARTTDDVPQWTRTLLTELSR